MTGGERIRLARTRKGLTQRELADQVGCSQQTIVDIEKQEVPSSRFLTKIIQALDETLEWIHGGVGGPASVVSDSAPLPHYDLGMAGLRAVDAANVDQATDFLYVSPVDVSRGAFTVYADAAAARLMPVSLRDGDVVWIDPARAPEAGDLLLVVLPHSDRAEFRHLVTTAGERYLTQESTDIGRAAIQCELYRSYEEFRDNDLPPEVKAALVVGVAVFVGKQLNR